MKAVKKVWRSIIQVFRVQTLHPYLLGNFGDCEWMVLGGYKQSQMQWVRFLHLQLSNHVSFADCGCRYQPHFLGVHDQDHGYFYLRLKPSQWRTVFTLISVMNKAGCMIVNFKWVSITDLILCEHFTHSIFNLKLAVFTCCQSLNRNFSCPFQVWREIDTAIV